jgi:ADP-ribose pyrophosphatase YjhB (NUDIX family)
VWLIRAKSSDLATRESELNRRFAVFVIAVPFLSAVGLTALLKASRIPQLLGMTALTFCLGAVTVVIAAHLSGFLPAFRLKKAAFIVVAEPVLSDGCDWNTRTLLLARQTGEPHKGKLIFPGGLVNPGRQKKVQAYARMKFEEMTGCKVGLGGQIARYKRRLPLSQSDVAYVGFVYEGFLLDKEQILNDVKFWTPDQILESPDIPEMVKQLTRVLQEKAEPGGEGIHAHA